MPRLERDGEVFILRLAADDENRFHPGWLTASDLQQFDHAPSDQSVSKGVERRALMVEIAAV